MRSLLLAAFLPLVLSCSPQGGEMTLNELIASRKGEQFEAPDQNLIDARWNENAKAINARMKAAYDRGVEVCSNIEKSGRDPGQGCPRPQPDYLPLK